jgi:2-polyprenyl-3-methyl-5-hydroxy-6-metoxy-1,4-benzoquinol methylase
MITAEQERQLAELWATSVGHYMHKFAMTPKAWYAEAMQIARGVGLDEGPPLKILDIGCGFGYFLAACNMLGHESTGLDVTDDLIARAAWILRVHLVPHAITAYEPLPAELTGYDLITTFGVNFRHAPEVYWGGDDYAFLAADIRKRLRPGGRWLLRPNQTDEAESAIALLMAPDWWREVAGHQATITVSSHEVEIRWQ